MVLALLVVMPIAAAQDRKLDRVEHDFGNDHFTAGANVTVNKPVVGDVFAVGGDVEVEADVGGDVVAAGGNLRLGGSAKHSVYAAGGRVSINGAVERNVRVAGGTVDIAPQAQVGGNLSVAAGNVAIAGKVKGYLQVTGARVYLNGSVDGDVDATGADVELGPSARIAGKLRYRSREEPKRDPSAQVQGGIEAMRPPLGSDQKPGKTYRAARVGAGWAWTIGLMLLAAILVWAFPNFCAGVAESARSRLGLSLLLGFVVLACVPAAALVLIITIVGIPLALLAMALYLALLLVGYVSAGIALGDFALKQIRPENMAKLVWRIGFAALTVLAIALLGRVPWVGGFLSFLAVLVGVGALVYQARPHRASVAAA